MSKYLCMPQVHERTLQSDFLMALLKDILAKRRARGRPLKVSQSQYHFTTIDLVCRTILQWRSYLQSLYSVM